MSDIIKRYGLWAILTVFVFSLAFKPEVINTVLIAAVAVCQTVIMAEFVQYIFTRLDWTNAKHPDVNETILSAKINTLGKIYVGTAILVGFVYLGVFFIQWLPGAGQ